MFEKIQKCRRVYWRVFISSEGKFNIFKKEDKH